MLDEGDPYSEILVTKSINNIKSLNFFRKVESEILFNEYNRTKTINISLEEKPTGEIYATAGVGTSGGSFGFGVKENNFLGNGINLDTNFEVSSDAFKGKFSVTNPNYNNTDKSLYISAEAIENDNYKTFGYKTKKTGFSFGTNYDKRNQKFQTSSGFRSFYSLDLPILSDTNTLKNYYNYSHYYNFFEKNISSLSFYFETANSLNNKNIKLSERINIPSSRLRGFERGRVGPKDGDDFIGGNYAYSVNFASNVPFIFEESQNLDFLIFADAADIWGVDYSSSIKGNGIRSSIGVALDWMSPLGPMNFSLAYPITKETGDKTESFRFNLGTTF